MRISDWSSDVCSSDLMESTVNHLPQKKLSILEAQRMASIRGETEIHEPSNSFGRPGRDIDPQQRLSTSAQLLSRPAHVSRGTAVPRHVPGALAAEQPVRLRSHVMQRLERDLPFDYLWFPRNGRFPGREIGNP